MNIGDLSPGMNLAANSTQMPYFANCSWTEAKRSGVRTLRIGLNLWIRQPNIFAKKRKAAEKKAVEIAKKQLLEEEQQRKAEEEKNTRDKDIFNANFKDIDITDKKRVKVKNQRK